MGTHIRTQIANLIAEAKFLRTMDCPFLLKCLETAQDDDWLVLILEYLSGGEVRSLLAVCRRASQRCRTCKTVKV